MSHRLERIVLALVVCLPVPAFALSGLSVPLPGVVERAAAALVPWADATTLETRALSAPTVRGSIVLEPGRSAAAVSEVEAADPRPARIARVPRVTRRFTTATNDAAAAPGVDETAPEAPRLPSSPDPQTDEESGTPAPGPTEPTVEHTPPQDKGADETPADEAPADKTPADKTPVEPDVTPADDPAPVPDPKPKDPPRPLDHIGGPPTDLPDITPGDPDATPADDLLPDVDVDVDKKPPKPDIPTRPVERANESDSGT